MVVVYDADRNAILKFLLEGVRDRRLTPEQAVSLISALSRPYQPHNRVDLSKVELVDPPQNGYTCPPTS